MATQFDELMAKYGIISEENNTDPMTDNGLPGPGTEVKFVANAGAHPFVKSKGQEFQDKVKQYIAEDKKKTRKYRLIISAVKNIRPSIELVSGSGDSLGMLADIVENYGTHNKGLFSVPINLLEIVNAAHNQNSGEIPDAWKMDAEKYGKYDKFNSVVKGYFVKGEQPRGTLANP